MSQELTDTMIFNKLAEEYNVTKKNAIINILKSGSILTAAKKQLSHGQFAVWLGDFRVSESQRTAERLMTIFNNFGHLLMTEEKIKAIENLPITFLLELQKLPERFRKDIEVITFVGDEEHREIRQVIDEDKLSNFLDTVIETKDGLKPLKELPVRELHKYVNNVIGVYEPENAFEDDSIGGGDAPSNLPVSPERKSDPIKELTTKLSLLADLSLECIKLADSINESVIFETLDLDKDEASSKIRSFKSAVESLYVKFNELEGKLCS